MRTLKNANVAVTGGAGFIGSHLTRALIKQGAHSVRILDSMECGGRKNLLDADGKAEILPLKLGDCRMSEIETALKGVDYVFHLAAQKHNQAKDRPAEIIRANIDGTFDLVTAASAAGVKKMIFSSSLYSYGRMSGQNMNEDEIPQPRTVYGMSKLAGEHLMTYARTQLGIQTTVLRYFFIYGPRQFAGMGYKSVIVSNFERAARGEAMTVYGDGSQELDYVYVDDAVAATISALERGENGETYNVSSATGTSVRSLLTTMGKVSGTTQFQTLPPDWTEGSRRVGDNQKIKSALEWSPQVSLEQGLQNTYAWMRENDD